MPNTRPVLRSGALDSTSTTPRPKLRQLRSTLVGARVDLLKTAVFSAVLLSVVGLIVHHGNLASGENQFAANAGLALGALTEGLSSQGNTLAASARAHTDMLSAAARSTMDNAAAQVGSALKRSAQPPSPAAAPVKVAAVKVAPARHVHWAAHRPSAGLALTAPHLLKVSLRPHRAGKHPVEHPVKLAALGPKGAKSAQGQTQRSMVLDAVDVASDAIGTQTLRAYYGLLGLIQSGTELTSVPTLRGHAQSWMNSTLDRFTSGDISTVNNPASFISNAFSIDSAVTVAAAILFVLVCMGMVAQVRSGLRGVGNRARA